MRKALRYAAAVLLLLFALAGCGGGESNAPEGSPPPAPAAALEPESVSRSTPEPDPEPAPVLEPAEAPEELYGLPPDTPVFVSKRSSTVHLVSDCCDMKHYREMTLEEAAAKGYDHCLHCF